MTKGYWNETTTPIVIADRPLKKRKTRQIIALIGSNGKPITWNSFFFAPDQSENNEATIEIDPDKRYQKIVGFGGALTGAVTYNADQLSPNLQRSLFESYFSDRTGIGYNLVRIPIGGCDFDLAPWGYNELPKNDAGLSNFTKLDPRDERMVDNLKIIQEIAGGADKIKIKAAAWSPPPWFKSNNDWTGASVLKHEYYQTWADYHVKYVELMEKAGIKLWAISTGNEPMNGVIGFGFVKFMSLGWTPAGQAQWIAEHLGPTIRNSTSTKDIKILAGDDQRFLFPWFFRLMKSLQPKAFDYVDGFGVHFYWDKFVSPSVLDETAKQFPGKLIINTESCLGDKPYQVHGPVLGSWERGVDYFEAYLQDLQHSVNGWMDWNLWLDESGGPNYVNNTVDSPIVVNATANEAYKQPMFYAIGHFSKFIKEDSVRVEAKSSHSFVDLVAFQRPDNLMVLVLQNKHQTKTVKVEIKDPRRSAKVLELAPDSFHTVLYSVGEE